MELIELGDKPSAKRVYVRREWPSSSTRPRREQEELALQCALTLQPSRSSTALPQHDCLNSQHALDEHARPASVQPFDANHQVHHAAG